MTTSAYEVTQSYNQLLGRDPTSSELEAGTHLIQDQLDYQLSSSSDWDEAAYDERASKNSSKWKTQDALHYGNAFYDAGNTTEDVYSNDTDATGSFVRLKTGQNVADGYHLVESANVGEGYSIYEYAKEKEGSTGLLKATGDLFGLGDNIIDAYDKYMVNELKDSATSGAILYGSDQRDEGRQSTGDIVGVNANEVGIGVETAELLAASIVGYATGQAWLPVVAATAQSAGKKAYGDERQREAEVSDIVESAAWSTASAIAGGYSPAAGAAVAGAKTKSKGGEWSDVVESAGLSYFMGTVGKNLDPTTKAGLVGAYAFSKGGDNRVGKAMIGAGSTYIKSSVRDSLNNSRLNNAGQDPLDSTGYDSRRSGRNGITWGLLKKGNEKVGQ